MRLNRRLVPDIRTLQAFECAARHLSFTRAAVELNLTQSAVSRQIRELETQLGVALFERVRQRVVLTASGEALLRDAQKLLVQTEDAVMRAMATAHATVSLDIAALSTFGSRWLMPRLPGFLAAHPGTVLHMATRDAPFSFEDEPFDIAIHHGKPAWPGATCTFLCDEWILPVAAPAVIAAQRPARPGDLAALPLLHLSTRPGLWAQWFADNGVETGSAYRGHRLDQFALVIEAVTAGLGLALLPRYLIEKELEAGTLAAVFDRPLQTDSRYYLAVPDNRAGSALTQAFSAWIIGQVSPAGRARGPA